jgi:hypothetical protein
MQGGYLKYPLGVMTYSLCNWDFPGYNWTASECVLLCTVSTVGARSDFYAGSPTQNTAVRITG